MNIIESQPKMLCPQCFQAKTVDHFKAKVQKDKICRQCSECRELINTTKHAQYNSKAVKYRSFLVSIRSARNERDEKLKHLEYANLLAK